ncbi:MAG: (2Fe-2S)-binding protein [Acidobacteriota bacterium]|nr:(2Fe-2S)-binding protein [Acidobacteriota bacterium]
MNAPSKVVTFTPLGKSAEAKENESVLDVARRAAVPLGNSCGGVGVCARCRIRVVSGAQNLSPATSIELRFGAPRGFAADERMACQAVVTGDCTVTTTYW